MILDLGCGQGDFLEIAKDHGAEVLGVDKSASGKEGILACAIEDLESQEKFDAVVLFHVLEHLADPAAGLRKAVSFLKKDGILVIEVPLTGNLTEKFLGPDYFIYQDKTHRHFFQKSEIVKLIKDQGLKIKKEGSTILEFPVHLIRASFQKSFLKGTLSLFLYLPFKILSLAGKNTEIIRLYVGQKPDAS